MEIMELFQKLEGLYFLDGEKIKKHCSKKTEKDFQNFLQTINAILPFSEQDEFYLKKQEGRSLYEMIMTFSQFN